MLDRTVLSSPRLPRDLPRLPSLDLPALQWWPGELCYDVVDEPLPLDTTPALPPDGAADLSDPSARPPPRPVPGYAARAAALGYRAVAGPSGTTANMLQARSPPDRALTSP